MTSKEISEAIAQQFGAQVDKRKIVLESDIKAFGSYTVQIKLHPGIVAELYVVVGETA